MRLLIVHLRIRHALRSGVSVRPGINKNTHLGVFVYSGWSVLAFLGLVISLICLLLGRIYRTFLINTRCNLFYDFAAGVPVCHMSAPAEYIGTGGIGMVYAGPVYNLVPICVYIISFIGLYA